MNREVPIMLSGITYSQFWETRRELTYDECTNAIEKEFKLWSMVHWMRYRKIEDARRNITDPMAEVDFRRSTKLTSTYILNVG